MLPKFFISFAIILPEILVASAAVENYGRRQVTTPARGSDQPSNYFRRPSQSLTPQFPSTADYCTRCGIRGGSQAYSSGGQKIVGGMPAEPMEFPWRCILFSASNIPGEGGFCSCTILSPEWVLTAAHCTYGHPTDKIVVDAGDYDLSDMVGRGGAGGFPNQVVVAEEVINHEGYDPQTSENDVAVIRLSRPLTFAPNVQPACLPYRFLGQSFDWQKITLAGWGYGSSNGSLTKILQKIDLTLIPVDACREFFAGYSVSIAPSKQVCAYQLPAGGKGSCYGDSGSSYDWLDPDSGRYYALGVLSFSKERCVLALGPTLGSRVTNFLDWIDHVTGAHFCG